MNENTRNFRSPSLLLGCAQPINRNLVICVGEERVQYLPDVVCCAFAFYLRRQRGLLLTKRQVSQKRKIKLLCIDYYISPQDTTLEIQSETIIQSRDEYDLALSNAPTLVPQHKRSFKLVGRQFQNKNIDH